VEREARPARDRGNPFEPRAPLLSVAAHPDSSHSPQPNSPLIYREPVFRPSARAERSRAYAAAGEALGNVKVLFGPSAGLEMVLWTLTPADL
jgi:hypothetical protein